MWFLVTNNKIEIDSFESWNNQFRKYRYHSSERREYMMRIKNINHHRLVGNVRKPQVIIFISFAFMMNRTEM